MDEKDIRLMNISLDSVIIVEMPPVTFKGLFDNRKFTRLKNDGKTVRIELCGEAHLKGGPLGPAYSFKQMHFHWGANLKEGSEHSINGKRYPLEAHFVFCDCQGICCGSNHDMVVVGLLFDMVSDSLVPFYSIFTYLSRISQPKNEIQIDGNILMEFEPVFKPFEYFTYLGSLPTSQSNEPVTWIIYKEVVPISSRQLMNFMSIMSKKGKPVQQYLRDSEKCHNRVVRESKWQDQDAYCPGKDLCGGDEQNSCCETINDSF